MEKVLLVRYTEIHLKGLNRPYFERALVTNMKRALRGINGAAEEGAPSPAEPYIEREHGRIYVRGIKDAVFDEALDRLTRVFGIHSISPAWAVDKEWETVVSAAAELMAPLVERKPDSTFKVFARRSDKHYFMNSDTINRELGGRMLVYHPKTICEFHVQLSFLSAQNQCFLRRRRFSD